jgi:hypothetical protein
MTPHDVADDPSRPLTEVVESAEEWASLLEATEEAKTRLYERGWRLRNNRWVPPDIEWPQLTGR